jgi:hypothetical protein
MKYGANVSNPEEYLFIAYIHPDGPDTFFACPVGNLKMIGDFMHHDDLVSPVRARSIPAKPDHNCWAIREDEYRRLLGLEQLVSRRGVIEADVSSGRIGRGIWNDTRPRRMMRLPLRIGGSRSSSASRMTFMCSFRDV